MADSDDESSVASEDWHYEFDDYHSQAAADIYTCSSFRERCLRALVDVMRYDPVEAVRNAAADGLRYTHGGLWLRYINPRQPMMDAFVVKKRKRRRRSSRRSKSL